MFTHGAHWIRFPRNSASFKFGYSECSQQFSDAPVYVRDDMVLTNSLDVTGQINERVFVTTGDDLSVHVEHGFVENGVDRFQQSDKVLLEETFQIVEDFFR